MANIKFSAFTVETDPTQIDALVGYQGTTMKQIAPGNIGGYPYLIDSGAGFGIDSLYSGFVPTGLSGSPEGNTVLGIKAGESNTTGFKNTNIGFQAGSGIVSTRHNVNVGFQAGLYQTGGDNTFIGYASGGGVSLSSTGGRNVAIGASAMVGLTTGNFNIAIGRGAAPQLSTASECVAIGGGALDSATTGGSNTAIGYSALSSTTQILNTAVGYKAGMAVTTNKEVTILGASAASATDPGRNCTIIGYMAECSTAGVSDEITIGNGNASSLRLPGLQSTASDGDVLTFSSASGNITLQAAGGGGASDLNGLSDCLVDTDSLYVGEVPAGLSGNPQDNTILGIRAGDSLTSGDSNTLIGNNAGDSITTGTNSVAVGMDALAGTSTVGNNVAVGKNAYKVGTAANNVYVGYDAGSAANTGSYQIGIGVSAGNSNTGSGSISIGWFANRNNTSDRTIAIGYQAAYSQTSGGGNTVIGERAAYSNTTGENNTSVGDETAYSSTGSKNTSVGKGAFGGGFGHSGTDNVAIGYLANQQPSGASNYNVAIGSEALRSSGTRSNNVAIGYKAGTSVTTGGSNVVIGYQAGDALTSASDNVAIGQDALGAGTSGRNVAIGKYAQRSMNRGSAFTTQNVAIGYNADANNNNGYYRTNVGSGTGGGDGANVTNIGYNAQASSTSAANEVTLGNSSVTALRCAVTSITSLSDERDKSEIKDLGYGLDFIDALQPREFVWDNRVETIKEYDDDENEIEVEFYSANKGKKDFGFIAQEVQALDDDTLRLVYDENPEKLELSYGKLVPVLVKAIQDLSAKVTALENA